MPAKITPINVHVFQTSNVSPAQKINVSKLIQGARNLGARVEYSESSKITPDKKQRFDFMIFNVAKLSKQMIDKLNELTHRKLYEIAQAKGDITERVIIYSPTEVERTEGIATILEPPPIIRALYEGKFFAQTQTGFLTIVRTLKGLEQSFLNALARIQGRKLVN